MLELDLHNQRPVRHQGAYVFGTVKYWLEPVHNCPIRAITAVYMVHTQTLSNSTVQIMFTMTEECTI